MIEDFGTFWRDQETEGDIPTPEALRERARRLDRRVKWRDAVEYIAGFLAIVGFGFVAVVLPDPWLRVASLMTMAGVALTCLNLWRYQRKNRENAPDPAEDCLAYLRHSLASQRAMLDRVALWYLGPLMPGLLFFYLVVFLRVAERASAWEAARGLLPVFLPTIGFFVFIWWLNKRTAASLKKQLDALTTDDHSL